MTKAYSVFKQSKKTYLQCQCSHAVAATHDRNLLQNDTLIVISMNS